MVRLTHSATHWQLRCIFDTSSEDENTPPNVQASPQRTQGSKRSEQPARDCASSTGTATPPWMSPEKCQRRSKAVTNRPPSPEATPPPASSPPRTRPSANPTTASPILLETPPTSPARPIPRKALQPRQEGRRAQREAAAPYSRRPSVPQRPDRPAVDPRGSISASSDVQFNPLATVFPAVPHFGWCDCPSPCRVDSCRNSRMHLYCNINCCPYRGLCGNALGESNKIYLGKMCAQRRSEWSPLRPLKLEKSSMQPERPTHPVRVAINAENLGGLMRFVKHSCEALAKFVEVSNGRRTTVVVASTEDIRQGQEVTVDYGDDLWFVCRCGSDRCRHRHLQDAQDP
ncbi:hypothetical protein PHYSODRAFT_326684 [Phytophthora sojae]|uniref:SET domain-containing protein n=1 Tax=Phytophthora sojae (strain P6497) TaxID=1094619 RepID=G4YXY8_PHYSP|nr:hypothetical protein PHYSODRAFT_326684 [Phytophthora sojae]EGZ25691.1 hypothetical protein PHYSODRAFT_326684 [Phytophthora sojae]|eukprot:XP_009520979.1 hypothetical protein PHYSODRAFT_326684 [Phytophthora sojae]